MHNFQSPNPEYDNLEYTEIVQNYFAWYITQFGVAKAQIIVDKVLASDKISGLIARLRYNNHTPLAKNFLELLNTIPYFFMPTGQTQALACLLALQRWNEEVNYKTENLSQQELKKIALEIITISKPIYR